MNQGKGANVQKRGAVCRTFFNVLLCTAFIGEVSAQKMYDWPFVWPVSIIKNEPGEYAYSLVLLFGLVRETRKTNSECSDYFEHARLQWMKALYGEDSTGAFSRTMQTSWPRSIQAPAPSVNLASWVIALHQNDFGVLGMKRVTWELLLQAWQRKAKVFAETENGLQCISQLESGRRKYRVMLSGNTAIPCGKQPGMHFCNPQQARQWIFVFASRNQACLFYRENRRRAQTAHIEMFWYAKFLKHYLAMIGKQTDPDTLPGIETRDLCDLKKK
jgi:hypothetical protein